MSENALVYGFMFLHLLHLRSFFQRVLTSLVELCLHRGISMREALDGEVVRLVVGQAQVVQRRPTSLIEPRGNPF